MHDSQSSITMMDLSMAQKRIIFRSLIASHLLIEVVSSVYKENPEDPLNTKLLSKKMTELMRTVTDEDVNKAIENLLKIIKE